MSFLASEDMVIYLNREGPDELIYGFDLNEWNLLILGEQNNWMEALESYDAVVSSPKMKPVIPLLRNKTGLNIVESDRGFPSLDIN